MEKYTCFICYQRNEHGAYQPARAIKPEGDEVYLARDVDQMRATFDARIADMERACVRNVEELEQQLSMANDAAAKGEKARTEAAGMQERIVELEDRYKRALSILALADKYIPTSKLDAYTAEAKSLMER